MQKRNKKTKRIQSNLASGSIDRGLFILTLILTILGIVAVADSSSPQALRVYSDAFYFAKQQLTWAGIGLFLLIVFASIPYRFWYKYGGLIYFAVLVLLVMVLLPGFGSQVLGARRWIRFGPIGFQPSELLKIAIAMVIARWSERSSNLWQPLLYLGLGIFLVMLQPDFGTSLVIVAIAISQLFVAGMPWLYFIGIGVIGGLMAFLTVIFSDYRRGRLMSFLQVSADPLGSSYHIRQILIALGSGGLFGIGLGNSRQKHLFIPETATDSVFAVIGEEVGFIGSLTIIILLVMFLMRIFKIAKNAPDDFSFIFAAGIGVWVGVQMFLNLASMVALTPITGIPLPFFSYGGSSLTTTLAAVGILLNISRHEKVQKKTNIRKRS